MAAEARIAWEERYPYLNRLHLSDLQGIRAVQIHNLQVNDRRNEQWTEIHRQWQWAHTVRATSAKRVVDGPQDRPESDPVSST